MVDVKILIWLVLSIILGVVIWGIYLRHAARKVPLSQKQDNKLGKAMINMERASILGDYLNFFEFAKYAFREAMKLPRGRASQDISVEEIVDILETKQVPSELIAIVSEVYQIGENVERSEEFDGDLKVKLEQYYEAIRKLNELFKKS